MNLSQAPPVNITTKKEKTKMKKWNTTNNKTQIKSANLSSKIKPRCRANNKTLIHSNRQKMKNPMMKKKSQRKMSKCILKGKEIMYVSINCQK